MPHEPLHDSVPPGQAYFDLEGDKELHASKSTDDGPPLTTWRGDPTETCADWAIVVVTSELQTITYHVHKSVLCFGTRQSRYFAKIMLNQTAEKKKNRKSRSRRSSEPFPTIKIELDQRDAENFPILLDFVYAPCANMSSSNATVATAASTFSSLSLSHSFLSTVATSDEDNDAILNTTAITTKNAVSLRYLARRFEVDSFTLVVNKFIQKDLSFKTGPTYLTNAWEYSDERLVESAQRLCAENFQQMDVKALTKLPVHLFRVVVKSLESFEEDNKELSEFLSEVVCLYFEKNPMSLSAGLLIELTDALLMPYIASEAAIGFTTLVKEMEPENGTDNWDGLVQLCRRCAKAVVEEYGWNGFSVNGAVDEYLNHSRGDDGKQVSQIDSLLFATSFAAALEQAQNDYEIITNEQTRLEETIEKLHQTVSLLEKCNDIKDKHMMRQQRVVEDAKRQILMLRQQISQAKEHHHQKYAHLQQTPSSSNLSSAQQQVVQQQPPTMTPEDIVRDLISPSQVDGGVMAARSGSKKMQQQQLHSVNQMRSKSLM